jgi:hypothetical protein
MELVAYQSAFRAAPGSWVRFAKLLLGPAAAPWVNGIAFLPSFKDTARFQGIFRVERIYSFVATELSIMERA